MRTTRILFILCGLFAAVPAWADMSGTYVGKGPALAVMIQIVETSGGNFTGRYERVVLQADGKIGDTNATISGTGNGETVVATIKTADFFATSVPVSGTYRGGVLHLTGGPNLVLNLCRADEADFRAQVAALTAQGQQIIDARTRQETRRALAPAPNFAAVVTANEIEGIRNTIRSYWNVPAGARDQAGLIVTLIVEMNQDGTPAKAEMKETGRYNNDPTYRAAADAAHRAIMNQGP
jgi:hypothetical protein